MQLFHSWRKWVNNFVWLDSEAWHSFSIISFRKFVSSIGSILLLLSFIKSLIYRFYYWIGLFFSTIKRFLHLKIPSASNVSLIANLSIYIIIKFPKNVLWNAFFGPESFSSILLNIIKLRLNLSIMNAVIF